MAPGTEKGYEKRLSVLSKLGKTPDRTWSSKIYTCLEVSQTLPELCKLRCSDEVVVEILHHDACKLNILAPVSRSTNITRADLPRPFQGNLPVSCISSRH